MSDADELKWSDLQAATTELIGAEGPGSAGWNGDASVTRAVNERFMRAFRANAGRVPGELEGVPCLILSTTGAKSGLRRPVPLACHSVDGKLLVIASMGGARVHPPWFHNLRVNPEVTVEKDGETYAARARITSGTERDALFASICAAMPVFAEYQARSGGRVIPVIELQRR